MTCQTQWATPEASCCLQWSDVWRLIDSPCILLVSPDCGGLYVVPTRPDFLLKNLYPSNRFRTLQCNYFFCKSNRDGLTIQDIIFC